MLGIVKKVVGSLYTEHFFTPTVNISRSLSFYRRNLQSITMETVESLICLNLALVTILIIVVIILVMYVVQLRKDIVELERPSSRNNPVSLISIRKEESTIPPAKPITGTCSWTRPKPRPGEASPPHNRLGEGPVPSAPGICSWTRPESRPQAGQDSPPNNRPGEELVSSAPATVSTLQVLAGFSQEQMQLHHQFVNPSFEPDSLHHYQYSTSNSSSEMSCEMIADVNFPDRPRLQTMDISEI
ncbi:uncharacterized protein LOC144657782 [Oculina patagonica]